MTPKILLSLTLVLAACTFEHRTRIGLLAPATDSLIPPGSRVECREPEHGQDGLFEYRVCSPSGGGALYLVERDGTILDLAAFWPLDSLGGARVQQISGELSARVTSIPRNAANTLTGLQRWRDDSVCYTIWADSSQREVQYARHLLSGNPRC